MSAVLTVDVQVEGIHFRRGWLEPRDIGWRAVASSASDLAAMAARPACMLVSLTLDGGSTRGEFQGMERGILAAARAHGLRLIGGNLSAGPLAISVTAVGEARATEALTRAGARPGDEIWVTGEPGLARLGLLALERGPRGPRPKGIARVPGLPPGQGKDPGGPGDRRPMAPAAMIDLSDGLALDLRRVLEESSRKRRYALGAVLEEEALASPRVARLARALAEPPAATALRGGEDYELLFTARPARRDRLAEAFRRRFGLRIARIGTSGAAADSSSTRATERRGRSRRRDGSTGEGESHGSVRPFPVPSRTRTRTRSEFLRSTPDASGGHRSVGACAARRPRTESPWTPWRAALVAAYMTTG